MDTPNRCEAHELLLSGWLDEPLPRDEQWPLVDHLVDCAACRAFYREARQLDHWVAAGAAFERSPAPPPRIWSAIEQRLGRESGRAWSGSTLLRAAAALILALGLGALFLGGVDGPALPPPDAEIPLGADAGQMTEARFLQLTREVLRADRHYRSAMYQVMQQVVHDTGGFDLPAEGLVVPAERRERTARESRQRDPA